MTDESGTEDTEDEDELIPEGNSVIDNDDSSPVSTQSDISQKLTPSGAEKEFHGYQTLGNKEESKTICGGTLFWTLLFAFSLVPASIVLNQYCQSGNMDSSICQNFQSIAHSAAAVIPGMPCLGGGGKGGGSGHSSPVDEDDSEELPSTQAWMKGPVRGARTLTNEEIKYTEDGPLYLVIIGHVFDVTKGKSYYAPGTGYFGFIGQDGSRAFVTGEFNETGLVDNIDDLSSQDYLGLANWIKFYFEKYKFVGYHVGRFFDINGRETDYFKKFKSYVKKAETAEEEEKDLRKLFPPCNIAWSAETGSRVWCTTQSGGIKRDWVGYPRQFFEGQNDPRCACVHPNFLNDPRVRPYENCDSKSDTCIPPEK